MGDRNGTKISWAQSGRRNLYKNGGITPGNLADWPVYLCIRM